MKASSGGEAGHRAFSVDVEGVKDAMESMKSVEAARRCTVPSEEKPVWTR